MSAAAMPVAERRAGAFGSALRDSAWTLGLLAVLALLLVFTKAIQPSYGVTGIQGLAISVLPRRPRCRGQRSTASLAASTSRSAPDGATSVCRVAQKGQSGVLRRLVIASAARGCSSRHQRRRGRGHPGPDFVVTLAMSFVWRGVRSWCADSRGGSAVCSDL